MSDGTVGHPRVGQASNASDFRPLVAPAAALPQVQCQTFSMSDIERSWRAKWPHKAILHRLRGAIQGLPLRPLS